jgi:hypothetical protein
MIVLIDCGEDMLFVPTWMITKSTNLKFVLPEKTNSKSLPMVAPGKAWVVLIQLYGDWLSDVYKRYLKFSLDDKISVATKMTSHILNLLNF